MNKLLFEVLREIKQFINEGEAINFIMYNYNTYGSLLSILNAELATEDPQEAHYPNNKTSYNINEQYVNYKTELTFNMGSVGGNVVHITMVPN